MPRRPTLPADTSPADLAAWISNAVLEAFTLPRVLPILRRPPAEAEPPLPLLFEGLPKQRKGEPAPEMTAPEPKIDDRDYPNFALMRRIVGNAIAAPSQIAITRRRLKRERAEAEATAAAVAAIDPVPTPATDEAPAPIDAMERLVASGIANEYIAGLGALRDPEAPWSPRSIGFPVTIHRVGGAFQPPTAPRIWELHLKTPACGDLPFVRRVEDVTGLKARWAPDRGRGSLGQWHHAVDLATDADWARLAASMEHTEPEHVSRAVGMHVADGSLSAANACSLLRSVGVEEPEERVCPNLRLNPDNGLVSSLGGWEAVYAIEDGLITPGNPKRHTYAQATDAGWRSVGKEPPSKDELKAARKAARC